MEEQPVLSIDEPSLQLQHNFFKIRVIFTYKYVWVYATWADTHTIQERASDPLRLDLEMIVSHHVDAENETLTLYKRRSTVNLWAPSLSPIQILINMGDTGALPLTAVCFSSSCSVSFQSKAAEALQSLTPWGSLENNLSAGKPDTVGNAT